NNKKFHEFLKQGIIVSPEPETDYIVKIIDFEKPENNDFLIANQVVIKDQNNWIRADLVIFVNGLPMAIFEFKSDDPNTTIFTAYKQLRDYKNVFPEFFHYNIIQIVSDGDNAKAGALTSLFTKFFPWKTLQKGKYPKEYNEQEVLIRELFDKSILLDLIKNFVVFENEKKIVGTYVQMDAVNNALKRTLKTKDGRVGVVWHNQGTGKSYEMVFYAMKLLKEKALNVPTIFIVTDRTELDEQISNTFANAGFKFSERAENIPDLRKKLSVPQGGIYFTTIHKFQTLEKEREFPILSERDNIIVMTDEAHRTQYDKFARNMRRALPNAKFIGFTGTPIEKGELKNTRNVFGNYISVYTISESNKDNITVPIYYEGRKAELNIDSKELDNLFKDFIKEYGELEQEKFKRKWSRMEALAGNDKRIKAIAKDIVNHFNNKKIKCKAMIVAISRKFAVKYKEIIDKIPDSPKT
ncbi:HsdR family type I site-specific deoxyribonuclease, partial [Candidatus Woesearchaeota archaeon]|nr:HsdR family type I site-specific deoxyribonuclease [Candidatus Woesearchaeota archaeon]